MTLDDFETESTTFDVYFHYNKEYSAFQDDAEPQNSFCLTAILSYNVLV